MTEESSLGQLAFAAHEEAQRSGYRRLFILSGSPGWCRSAARAMTAAAFGGFDDCLWSGDEAPSGSRQCNPADLMSVLGSEWDALILDAHDGLDPDGLGASMGTVRTGGLVLLLAPELDHWPAHRDAQVRRLAVDGWSEDSVGGRFIERLTAVLVSDPFTVVVREGEPPPVPAPLAVGPASEAPEDPECLTRDQAAAVNAVVRTATGHRRRPTVLTADRGRGKSAALGIAAARVLRQQGGTVVVTGPHRSAAASVLRHAADSLGVTTKRGVVRLSGGAQLRFVLPDELSHLETKPSVVLVDEAAALPTALLVRMLRSYSRIAFATTVHGYEGSGRGFLLRFQPEIEARCQRRQNVTLEEPIRWRRGDPVEQVLFRALLLDADVPVVGESSGVAGETSLTTVDRDTLTSDETLLRSIFGLLVHAHYRTRPLDLRNLMDGPNLMLKLLWRDGNPVAAALVAREGPFPPEVGHAIWSGQRRPRGHLLPQSLASHVGLPDGASIRVDRVMRIAVHPECQGQGLGTRLLSMLADDAATERADALGASFGATGPLLNFWRRAGCEPVHLGMRRDAASGTHSAVVLRPLTEAGHTVFADARRAFARSLVPQLGDPLRDVETEIAVGLLAGLPVPEPDDQDWLDLAAFACGHRAYEVSIAGLRRVAAYALAECGLRRSLPAPAVASLVARIIQQRTWREAAENAGLSGRPALIQALREAGRELFVSAASESVRSHARRLGLPV